MKHRVFSRTFPCSCFFLFLLMPLAAGAETYAVKHGDSLSRISNKFHVSISGLREANELGNENLRPGQRLFIPPQSGAAGKTKKLTAEARETRAEEIAVPETHTVKKGETLAKIARRYHLRVEELRGLNELKGKRVKPGQVLRLATTPEEAEEIEEEPPQALIAPEQPSFPAVQVAGSGLLTEEKERQLLVRVAKSFLGTRYSRGGTTIHGMDCSAYVQKVFRVFDINLPRTAREQFQVGYPVKANALKLGDLLFFKRTQAKQPTHVGIYIGEGKFIHTSLSKRRVEIESLSSRYFNLRFIGAKRIQEKKLEETKEQQETKALQVTPELSSN